MSAAQKIWSLPDSAKPSRSKNVPHLAPSRTLPPGARAARSRCTEALVLVLIVATSLIAMADLYLLLGSIHH
ncbi:MAG: hypothetical protein ACYCST_17960 [Acidimicrobiales bacterium]